MFGGFFFAFCSFFFSEGQVFKYLLHWAFKMISRVVGSSSSSKWIYSPKITSVPKRGYSTKKITVDRLSYKKKVLQDKQKETATIRDRKKEELESFGTLNESLLSFFGKNLYKEQKTTSKTTEAISSIFSIYPPKFDIDESSMSNKQYRESGLAGEVCPYACRFFQYPFFEGSFCTSPDTFWLC